jgi:diguanylate cyclase (GGDEF)-like protein/PAS domain S-box-containing protein
MTRGSVWLAPGALIVGASGAAFAANFASDLGATIVRAVIGGCAVAAILYGAWRHGAQPRIVWSVIAMGIGVWVVGDTLWDTFDLTLTDSASNWYILPNVLYVIMYPALVWAIVILVSARGRKAGVEQVVDAFVPALMLLLVLYLYFVRPQESGTSTDAVFNTAFLFCDALLLTGVAWLMFAPGMWNPAAALLVAGVMTLLASDVIWDIEQRVGTDSWDWLVNPMYPVAYALIAASALHPSVAALGQPAPEAEHTNRNARLVLLSAAAAMLPLVAFEARRHDLFALALTSTLVGLLLVRFATLVRALQRAEESADVSARRFRGLVSSAPVGIFEADAGSRIVFSNDATKYLLGVSVVGMTDDNVVARFIDPRDQGVARSTFAKVRRGQNASAQLRLLTPDAKERWVALYCAPVQDGSGRFAGAFASTIDITPMKAAELILAEQALHDPLTGLPNRRLLYDRLSTALARLNRQPGTVVVMFLDLDGFKAVNDSCGHDAGDELLKVIAARLVGCVRADDVVARFGGDEFVIVLERVPGREEAAAVAAKIVKTIAAPVWLSSAGSEVSVGASVGVTITAEPSADPDGLTRDADAAMFDAKRSGRGRFCFFDPARSLVGKVSVREGGLLHKL